MRTAGESQLGASCFSASSWSWRWGSRPGRPALARPKPQPCPDGHYLVEDAPLLSGVATTPAEGITIAEGQITLDGACPGTAVKLKAKRRGTNVRGRWPLCDGVEGTVRLKGKIEPTCQTPSLGE